MFYKSFILSLLSFLILGSEQLFATEQAIKAAEHNYGLLALLPALIAIIIALISKQVLLALSGGILSGLFVLTPKQDTFLSAFPKSFDLLIQVLNDADRLKVICFTLMIGAMVHIVQKGGGSLGLVQQMQKFVTSRKSAQLSTWFLGLLIFFDDYASSLLVGTSMRPLTDKMKVSREKLSYIVDSTAAPIASIAVVSSWIGYEIDTMGAALKASALVGAQYNAAELFYSGIPARFYPICALFMVFLVAYTGRDFGPMHTAEMRALNEGKLLADGDKALVDTEVAAESEAMLQGHGQITVAIVPFATLIGVVFWVLNIKGSDASYDALLYASAASVVAVILTALALKTLNITESLDALTDGIKSMVLAIMILVLAWGIGEVMKDLHAGQMVASLLGDGLPSWSLPTVTFLLSALIALSTGTSWGTMAILFPIVIPIVALHQDLTDFHTLLIGTTSAILAGAVFGDHCSPISDTTVLSSIASASDHLAHTKTQLPYALFVGVVSVLCGTLPIGFGVSPWICLTLSFSVLAGCFLILSKKIKMRQSHHL